VASRPALVVSPTVKQQALAYLAERYDEDTRDIDVIWLMADMVEQLPAKVPLLQTPIPDDPNGLPDALFAYLQRWAKVLSGVRVLTVCHMGENRSGLASALLLMAQGKTAQGAIAAIRASGTPLTDNPYFLWNPGFVRQLEAVSGQ